MIIKGKTFKEALKDKFTQGVNSNKYKRIPYKDWRKYMEISDTDDVSIAKNVAYNTIDFAISNWDSIKTLSQDDDCLGQFLCDVFFKGTRKEIESLTNTTSSVSNAFNEFTTAVNTNWVDICQDERYTYSDTAYPSNLQWVNTGTGTLTWSTTLDEEYCKKSECPLNKNKEEKKEEKSMLKNFDFGPCTNDNVRMSLYGLAVKNSAGSWVSYNKDSKQIIDVDILNFDGRKFLFKMPVAIDQIAVGDIVIHNRVPMFVTDLKDGIHAVDAVAGEAKTIIPTTNMFGLNFVTKVVSLLDVYSKAPTPDQPFGNLLPIMLMKDGNMDSNTLFALSMMNGGGITSIDTSNPMMLYFLMKDGDNKDSMLPLLLLSQMQKK